jgi:NitT/TauT family transport system ATP-binding protein
MTTPALLLERITCTFASRERQGDRHTAVSEATISVAAGEFVSVVGPTGMRQVDAAQRRGRLAATFVGRRAGARRDAAGVNRHAGYMFQAESLMPWRSALDNVLAGLEFAGISRAEAETRAREWLARVGLAGFERRYPHELSGGMRKRVALAQMLILDPQILLMDEPFSALDVQTRQMMENELLDLWSANRKSVLFITHDLEEAIALSDRVVVLSAAPRAHPIGEFAIDLLRPRDVNEIRLTPRFVELHTEMWHKMKNEVLKGYAQTRAA